MRIIISSRPSLCVLLGLTGQSRMFKKSSLLWGALLLFRLEDHVQKQIYKYIGVCEGVGMRVFELFVTSCSPIDSIRHLFDNDSLLTYSYRSYTLSLFRWSAFLFSYQLL